MTECKLMKQWKEPNWLAKKNDANKADVDVDPQYDILFKVRNWRITKDTQLKDPRNETPLDGPSMWHKGCQGFTHILSRSNPKCSKCSIKIPEKIQTIYTLLNWQHGTKKEYFVD